MVRAKFKLNRIEITTNQVWKDGKQVGTQEMRTLHFSPVYGNGDPNHENTKFWNASPIGELRLGTVNPEAWQHFKLDGEYYLDFTLAPAAEPST